MPGPHRDPLIARAFPRLNTQEKIMMRFESHIPAALMLALTVAACGGRSEVPSGRVADTVVVPSSPAATGTASKPSHDPKGSESPAEPRRDPATGTKSGGASDSDGKNDIVPGSRVGGVKIGEEMGKVVEALGEPDSSDAAMGHMWSWWISHKNDAARQELGIYASFDNDATGHYVRQIRLTSPYFVTSNGISTRSSLADILRAFKDARAVAKYSSPERGGTIYLYDDKMQGIAFEVFQGESDPASGRCIAIVVHMTGGDPANQYLGASDYTPIGGHSPTTGKGK
jgi:hypothetical protein